MKFVNLVTHSDRVVCMDANISEETMQIIKDLRFVNKNARQEIYKYYNTFKPKNDY